MSISKEKPNKNDFEELYQNKNPWNFDGTLNDLIRLKILHNIFKDTYFQRGLDVACGEGFLTARINLVWIYLKKQYIVQKCHIKT